MAPRPAGRDDLDAGNGRAAHTSAGARVRPHAEPVAGLTVALAVRVGPAWVVAGCRVTEVVDTTNEYGFTYVTLPGHPERWRGIVHPATPP
jgi:uncharacterized protein (UPF0548 family)